MFISISMLFCARLSNNAHISFPDTSTYTHTHQASLFAVVEYYSVRNLTGTYKSSEMQFSNHLEKDFHFNNVN